MEHSDKEKVRAVYEQLGPHVGKVIPVRIRMRDTMGEPKNMLYVGQNGKEPVGTLAQFVLMREEHLDGKVGFRGVTSALSDLSYEDRVVTIDKPYDDSYSSILLLSLERIAQIEELWGKRHKLLR